MGLPIDYDSFVAEFEWTRDRHGGSIAHSAPLFGITPFAMARRLYRARAAGHTVRFHDDIKPLRRAREAA